MGSLYGFPSGAGVGGFGIGGTEGGVPPLNYYLGLLTSEYRNSPNLNAWLASVLQPLIDLATCLSQFATPAFDLDWAVGDQLDVLGEIIGVSRKLPFQPTGGLSPILGDSDYRILLKARIGQNQWNGKIPSVYPIWQNLFPGGIIAIEDNQNMTATIILAGNFTPIIIQMIEQGIIVPRPEGVQYTYIFPLLPMFGYDIADGSYIAGYDEGHWV